jgi:diguanylate cyclase (GGDEF)-like protein
MTSGRSSRFAFDPRALVAAAFLLVFGLGATSVTLFVDSADEAQRSLRYAGIAVEVPLEHLDDAIEANTVGEAHLQRAAAATGDLRDELLAQSVAAGETASAAWRSYLESALPLPGEGDLASTYERDYSAGKAIAARVLVPILQSGAPGFLPSEQIAAAERNRQNLLTLRQIYAAEDSRALASLASGQQTERDNVMVAATILGALVLVAFVVSWRSARRAVTERDRQIVRADHADLDGRLTRAYDLAEDDCDAFRVAGRAVSNALPGAAVSILVADTSQTTFAEPVGKASCGVEGVVHCPAARGLETLQFSHSGSLDTCPALASGASTPCAVTCVPVAVAGMRAAVVQLSGPVGSPPDPGAAVPLIVRLLGEHLTTARELARFQRDASLDPLTGLLNRRSLEDAVARLDLGDTYAVGFADLDHFKLLNDVQGHDIGDRALRAFAATLKATLRPGDLVGRWGGEEFVMILPGCGQQQAVDAMNRVRAQMALEVSEGTNVSVTVSVGVAVRDPAEPFELVVTRADRALHVAKTSGRNRVEAWKPRSDAAAELDDRLLPS